MSFPFNVGKTYVKNSFICCSESLVLVLRALTILLYEFIADILLNPKFSIKVFK
jgi:hypothetical protein